MQCLCACTPLLPTWADQWEGGFLCHSDVSSKRFAGVTRTMMLSDHLLQSDSSALQQDRVWKGRTTWRQGSRISSCCLGASLAVSVHCLHHHAQPIRMKIQSSSVPSKSQHWLDDVSEHTGFFEDRCRPPHPQIKERAPARTGHKI